MAKKNAPIANEESIVKQLSEKGYHALVITSSDGKLKAHKFDPSSKELRQVTELAEGDFCLVFNTIDAMSLQNPSGLSLDRISDMVMSYVEVTEE